MFCYFHVGKLLYLHSSLFLLYQFLNHDRMLLFPLQLLRLPSRLLQWMVASFLKTQMHFIYQFFI